MNAEISSIEKTSVKTSFIEFDILEQAPYLGLNSDTNILDLVLPILPENHEILRPQWAVITHFLDRSATLREFAAPEGVELPLHVGIPAPFSAITVALRAGDEVLAGPLSIPGISEDRPFLLLDGEGRVCTGELSPLTYTLLAPQGTTVEAGDPAAARPLGEWAGWQTCALNAHGRASISVALPLAQPVELEVAPAVDFEWDTEVKVLPNARALDGAPIYTQSPKVLIHAEGDWLLDLTYAPLGGEAEAISEDELEAGGAFEVLPSDLYEDPWVGRYRLSLFRDGEEVDVRYFTIAEGLHMRFKNEGPRGTDFRFIDALGKYSPFSYTLASNPAKPIALDKKLRHFTETEAYRIETVASEAGYELDIEIVPESLVARVKYIGTEPADYLDKTIIPASQLDLDANFTVYSPRPLPLAKFVTIDKRQKIKELARTSGTTQAATFLSVPNATLAGAVRKQPSAELFLMWSTLSYEDYLAGLPEAERASHLNRSLDRRILEYEASAATSLIYAAIATVRKAPLASRAMLSADGIAVELNGEEAASLIGWAWPLDDPASAAVALRPTEAGFELPESLAEAGALLVDVREHSISSNLAAPARPSSSSLVASREEGTPTSVLASEEWSAPELWQAFHALHTLSLTSPNAKLQAMFDSIIELLRSHPRAAVAALGESGINPAQQARALVRSRLFHARLDEGEPVRLDQYPSLLAAISTQPEALAEAASPELAQALATGADTVTRPLLLNAASAATPNPQVTGLAGEAARILALRECFANNAAFEALGTLDQLSKDATALSTLIQEAGVDMSVSHTLIALGAFASASTAPERKAAAWMPYISYVFALAARAQAAGTLPDTPLLKEDMPLLADAMPLAPRLFFYDLLTAEALFQAK
ncbi:hypothetical protein ACWIB8_07885 [Corynebacterium flavescens]